MAALCCIVSYVYQILVENHEIYTPTPANVVIPSEFCMYVLVLEKLERCGYHMLK